MKDARRQERILPRGRIAQWSREQMDKLSTLELRALLDNAERLHEPEVAALCSELLSSRPHGHTPARRREQASRARDLVTRGKAFELNGIAVRSRQWSRGGQRSDGAVLLIIRAEHVERASGGAKQCLLWAPHVGDSPGGNERREHCGIAIQRGDTHGLMTYGDPGRAERVDARTVLDLQVEQRGEEYWATWA
jgi:hypothetical protein